MIISLSIVIVRNRWINDTDNWIYDAEDTDRPMLCGNLTGARHCPTGKFINAHLDSDSFKKQRHQK